jgi:hypothetical protein
VCATAWRLLLHHVCKEQGSPVGIANMGRPLVTVKSCHPRRLGEARSAFAVSLIVSSSFVPYSDSCLVTDKKCLGEAKADSALRTMDIGLEDLRQRSETHLALANRPSLGGLPGTSSPCGVPCTSRDM